MDFVTLREFRTQPGKIWMKLTKEHELVVTRNGKPFALLTETYPTSFDEDLARVRRARFAGGGDRVPRAGRGARAGQSFVRGS